MVPVVIVVVVVVAVGGGRHGLASPIADGGSGQGASCCGCWRWVFLQHLLRSCLRLGCCSRAVALSEQLCWILKECQVSPAVFSDCAMRQRIVDSSPKVCMQLLPLLNATWQTHEEKTKSPCQLSLCKEKERASLTYLHMADQH